MDGQRLISDQGKRNLALMVETWKAKIGNPDWFLFTDHLVRQSEIVVTKDVFYRTAQGIYKERPDVAALAALARAPDFTFINSDRHPSMDELVEVLMGNLDAYGKWIEVVENHKA